MTLKSAYSADNPPFIDIHTHRRAAAAGVLSVANFTQYDLEKPIYTEGVSCASVGLHPWFLTKENFKKDIEKMSQLIDNQQVIAIGECGLDKLKGEDLVFQTLAFEAQIRLAESVSKPVVVHCVRAFGEVISVKKKLKPTVPLIIHGFNKKAEVLTELLKQGFFISIGSAILQKKGIYTEGSLFSEMFRQIPLERLFFETDDAQNVVIEDIYQAACVILEMDINGLKSVIYKNFNALFVRT